MKVWFGLLLFAKLAITAQGKMFDILHVRF